ncbi:TetR family transcriptional regulator [Nocardia arthritidis]|uniref:TetR family transcriptional regulator n=2 Tax=Nocardia arthritidis TaxID=228602 RepID=A0A6G9YMC9_9NOCA|nr:TetR family transcriptional regulator [Nocardia arthritidis]
MTVIAERGIEGLTHRAAAEAAGVPLGSTTYYFADRDDLIGAALELAVQRYADYLADWAAEHGDATPGQVCAALTDAVLRCFGDHRERELLEFELYAAAARRPALRPHSDRFVELSTTALGRYFDPVTAAAGMHAMTGLILNGLAQGGPPDRAAVAAVLRHVLRVDEETIA